jgi:prepilin-type N-terminal cleavage/methylation domain-containing protein
METAMTRTPFPQRPGATGGFTLIELLIVVALIGVLASITAPFLISAKSAANEASAIGSTRTINTAQTSYASTCGLGFYASNTLQLVNGDFASMDISLPIKSGFAYTLGLGDTGVIGPVDCNGDPTFTEYYYSATPLSPNTGRRGFATNEAQTIWVDAAGVAPVEPFIEAGTVGPIR